MQPIKESELIINPDGSVYHLNLRPEDIGDTIIFVGDPDRVAKVSKHFNSIEIKKQKREFVAHTGYYNNKRITVLSTGIGTDNIDIVMNELDALVNIDLATRTVKEELTSLKIVRIGTSGCLQEHIPVDSILLSSFGMGLDGLLAYYKRTLSKQEQEITRSFQQNYASIYEQLPVEPQFAQAGESLLQQFTQQDVYQGITISCTGFYAPQGRAVRLQPAYSTFLDDLTPVQFNEHSITNFEMETSAIYGMANMLGHQALSVNCLIANRARGEFSARPKQAVEHTIEWALQQLA